VAAGVAARVADMGADMGRVSRALFTIRSYCPPRKKSRTKYTVRLWLAGLRMAPFTLASLAACDGFRPGAPQAACLAGFSVRALWSRAVSRKPDYQPQMGRGQPEPYRSADNVLGSVSARPSLLRTERLIPVPRCGAQFAQCPSPGWLGCVNMHSARLDLERGDHSRSV
jgi:hypothetical protein